FAGMDARVVQAPQLRTLALGIPLPELVAEGKDPLLGAGLFLVAARTADARVEAVPGDGVEQSHRLMLVAALVFRAQMHPPVADRLLDAAHDQAFTQLCGAGVAEGDDLGKVVD